MTWLRLGVALTVLSVVFSSSPLLAADVADETVTAPETPTDALRDDPGPADPVDEIIVRAERVPANVLHVPAAVTVVDQESIQLARPQLTLGESLTVVPGVFTQNRQNFAQDLRISIRGSGCVWTLAGSPPRAWIPPKSSENMTAGCSIFT